MELFSARNRASAMAKMGQSRQGCGRAEHFRHAPVLSYGDQLSVSPPNFKEYPMGQDTKNPQQGGQQPGQQGGQQQQGNPKPGQGGQQQQGGQGGQNPQRYADR
jgi:hypothetical protein